MIDNKPECKRKCQYKNDDGSCALLIEPADCEYKGKCMLLDRQAG